MVKMEEHFQTLEELINDDDKIVTVASYALTASIPVKESQKVFDKFVEVNKGSKQVHCTYVLNGTKKDSGKFTVVQVTDDALDTEKQIFQDDVLVTIFSIQKAKQIDYNVISLVEQDSESKTSSLLGTVVGKNCARRVLRKNVLPPLSSGKISGKSTIFTKQNGVKSGIKSEEKLNSVETKVEPKGSITSMFNKATQGAKSDTSNKKLPEQKSKQNGGGLQSFFTKQAIKKEVSEEPLNKIHVIEKSTEETKPNCKDSTDTEKCNKKSDLFDSDTDDEILKDLNIEQEQQKQNMTQPVSNPNKKLTQKKKRMKSDVGSDKSAKKRKRIIVDEDSENDDIFGSDKSESEDIMEKSDEEPEPTKIEAKTLIPKNKRRKAVKKIYEDDEGYIVSQTEYVYETASEDEGEPDKKIAKKEVKPNARPEKTISSVSENEISPNKATKSKKPNKKAPSTNQPTLMNFFKRK